MTVNGVRRNQTSQMIVIVNVLTNNLGFAETRFTLDAPDYLDREAFPSKMRSNSHVCLKLLNKRSLNDVEKRHDDLCVPFTRDAFSRMSDS